MQRLEVSGAVRPIYGSLGVKRLIRQIYRQLCFRRSTGRDFFVEGGEVGGGLRNW